MTTVAALPELGATSVEDRVLKHALDLPGMTYFLGNWRFWAGVLVSVVTLALLVLLVDRRELWEALRTANYLYLAPAIALYFIGQWFRALRWQYLLSPIASISARRLYPVIIIGYMANNVLPARLGELVRAVYLSRREPEVSIPASIATLSVERLYDGLTLLALGAVAAPILLAAGLFSDASLAYRSTAIVLMAGVVGSFVAALAILTALACSRRTLSWFIGLTGLLPARFRVMAAEIVVSFVEGLGMLNSPAKHATLFVRVAAGMVGRGRGVPDRGVFVQPGRVFHVVLVPDVGGCAGHGDVQPGHRDSGVDWRHWGLRGGGATDAGGTGGGRGDGGVVFGGGASAGVVAAGEPGGPGAAAVA